jgi:hypothetical protein
LLRRLDPGFGFRARVAADERVAGDVGLQHDPGRLGRAETELLL